MVAISLKKDARLDLKTTSQNKELLAQAAMLSGVDMTTFIMEKALKAAKSVVEQAELQQQEQQNLFAALSKPMKPTKALKEMLSEGTFDER